MADDQETLDRQTIARSLVHRCTNCYRRLPGPVGCGVHAPGWNWLNLNLGPFCDDCYATTRPTPPLLVALRHLVEELQEEADAQTMRSHKRRVLQRCADKLTACLGREK